MIKQGVMIMLRGLSIKTLAFLYLIIFLLNALLFHTAPLVSAQDRCDEAYLRNIRVSIVSCTGEANQCVAPGVINGEITWITWGEGVWGSGSEIYVSNLSPPYTIEQWAIHVLKNISRKSGIPESSLVTQAKVVSLIAWSRAEGGGVNKKVGSFNPLNTKLSHSDLGGVNQGNPATDSNSQGYPDFDRGVEAITRALFNGLQKRIASAILSDGISALDFIEAVAGDFVAIPYGTSNQNNVVNNLEDVYPGDRVFAALSITGFDYGGGIGDRAEFVRIKQGTLKNAQENYQEYASKLLDSFGQQPPPPGTPKPLVFDSGGALGDTYTGGACEHPDTGAAVSSEGYAFPLAPQTKAVIGVNQGHHDETPAFDLYSFDSAPVYAIYSGTIDHVNTSYSISGNPPVPGCTTIQFQADDGFYYWYGHMKNPRVSKGQQVQAGTILGEVADRSFGSACWGEGPHLHIDRGCTIDGAPQRAGNKNCRDPDFIPFLRGIYDQLP